MDKDLLLMSSDHYFSILMLFAVFSLQDLKRYGATTVVRVCDITYDKTPLEKDGINVVVRHHYTQITFIYALEVLCVTNILTLGLAV